MDDIERGERPPDRRSVVGVYRNAEQAEALAQRIRALDISEKDIAVDDERAYNESIVMEMQEEAGSATSPQVKVGHRKETVKSMALLGIPITIVCALLALPLALIEMGDLPLWLRLVICALIGAAAGSTIAIVAGATVGIKRSNEPLAVQRGTSVRVATWSPELIDLMAAADPIRLDVIDPHGARLGHTATTEDSSIGTDIASEVNRNPSGPEHEHRSGQSGQEQDRRS